MEFDLDQYNNDFGDAIRERRWKDAAVHHKRIIDLRKELPSRFRYRTTTEKAEANMQQAVLLLMSDDEPDRSLLPPDMEELSRAKVEPKLWGILCARVGALYMRSPQEGDLAKAKTYFNLALEALVKLDSPPLQQMASIAQTLADLYDFTKDMARAVNTVKWLGQQTKSDVFEGIRTGRMSEAVEWCTSHGFSGTRFDKKDPIKGMSALEHAIRKEDHDKLETLLIFTERTTPSGTLPSRLLLTAAEMRSLRICQLLFDHKAGVDAVDENNRTVLHRCQHCPKPGNQDGPKIAGLFLSKDPGLLDKKDGAGKTALYMACEAGSVEMVQFLLKSSAKPNLTEINGKTPLYLACERGDRQIVRCLLSKAQNLDLNTRGPGGLTPLIVAVKFAATHAEGIIIVQELLRKGADSSIEDSMKKSAISYAGGVWASDLRRALKNGTPNLGKNPAAAPLMTPANIPQAGSGHGSPYLRSSQRSGSTVSKLGQMVSSATPSFLSRSRTSFAPSSKPTSTFSRDLGSRRTSWTTDYESLFDVNFGGAAGESSREPKFPSTPDQKQVPDPAQPSPRQSSDGPEGWPAKGKEVAGRRDVPEPETRPFPPEQTPDPHMPPTFDELTEHSSDSDSDVDPNDLDPIERDEVEGAESNSQSTDFATATPSRSSEDSYFGDIPLHRQVENLTLDSGSATEHASGAPAPRRASHNDQSLLPTSTSSRGQPGSVKRLGRPSGSNAGRDKRRMGTSTKGRGLKTRQQLLACPFAKKDPFKYARCNHHELTKIRFVKQHITRYHQQHPYCVRCMQVFVDEQDRNEHVRTSSCLVVQHDPPDGITPQQQVELSRKSDATLSEAGQWYAVFRITFPDCPLPESPYRDELVNMSVYNTLFTHFIDNQVPEIVTNYFTHRGNNTSIGYDDVVNMVRSGMTEFTNTLHQSQQDGMGRTTSPPIQSHIPISTSAQQHEAIPVSMPVQSSMFSNSNPVDQVPWLGEHSPESAGGMSMDSQDQWQPQYPLAPITEISSSESPGESHGREESYVPAFAPAPTMPPELSDQLMNTQQSWFGQIPADPTFNNLADVGWGMQAMPDPESPHDSWLHPNIESVQREIVRGLMDDRGVAYVSSDHTHTPPSQ